MSLTLSNDYNLSENTNTQASLEHTGENVEKTSSQGSSSTANVSSAGKIISGTIISIKNNMIQIALKDNSVIAARVENGIKLILNSTLNFELVESNDNQILLKPCGADLKSNPTILNALNTAQIPVTEESVDMVNQMMKQGISIDKQTLRQIYQKIIQNGDDKLNDILTLKKMDIPMTTDMLDQLTRCKNLDSQLGGAVSEVMDELEKAYNEICAKDGVKSANHFLMTVFQEVSSDNGNDNQGLLQKGVETEHNNQVILQDNRANIQDNIVSVQDNTISVQDNTASIQDNTANGTVAKENMNIASETVTQPEKDTLIAATSQEEVNTSAEITAQAEVQKENGLKQPLLPEFDWLEEETVMKPEVFEHLKKACMERWSYQPARDSLQPQTEAGVKLDRIYQDVKRLSENILKYSQNNEKIPDTLLKTASQLKSNVDFLQYMNESYHYLQIPLKLSERYKNSELHVYTNKKNLADKDGDLTAALHLEMDHLGTVDVSVRMRNNQVSTHFVLADEKAIDLIEQNMEQLNRRFEAKGFQAHATTELRKEENIQGDKATSLHSDKEEQVEVKSLYQYSFDVKA